MSIGSAVLAGFTSVMDTPESQTDSHNQTGTMLCQEVGSSSPHLCTYCMQRGLEKGKGITIVAGVKQRAFLPPLGHQTRRRINHRVRDVRP